MTSSGLNVLTVALVLAGVATLCCLDGCAPPSAVLSAVDDALPRLIERYQSDGREAMADAGSPREAWDRSNAVLTDWSATWWATRAAVETDAVPAFCAARLLWARRGVRVDDRGLCRIDRCWVRP